MKGQLKKEILFKNSTFSKYKKLNQPLFTFGI